MRRLSSSVRRIPSWLIAAFLVTVVTVRPPGPGSTASAVEPGATPASAIEISVSEVQGTVRSSLYYMVTAPIDGILDIALTPMGGEIDLAVVHVSGSPAIESRKEGEAREEISMRVAKGDRFLVRVISPFGRSVAFKLTTEVTAPAVAGAASSTFVPRLSGDGRTESAAIMIPLGQIIPVQAEGRRFFRVTVPKGAVLAVSLYPLHGDADLMVTLGEPTKPASISRRRGLFSEHVFLPITLGGDALVAIMPSANNTGVMGPMQYGIVARLRHSGVTSTMADLDTGDRETAMRAFADTPIGSGVPSRSATPALESAGSVTRTGVLRLP
jgi:hypothetical protein